VLGRELDYCIGVVNRVRGAWDQRSADLLGDVSGPDLVAQCLDGGGRRSDPDEPGSEYGLGEGGVFCEKAIPWVNGVGAAAGCDVEDFGDVQLSLRRGGSAQRVCLIRERDEQ
jgi:hypothetical protein